ncbi:MAG: sialate O-acetylesterase [bacterium]|nr:sialate O-acetylesterase [bacterium]
MIQATLRSTLGAAALLSGAVPGMAQALELASPFVDGAILQRSMPVPVWGWAEPGSSVAVSFAGQRKSTTTDERGDWIVELDPLTASHEERELVVRRDGAEPETLNVGGVLVGEVWFSSGQSNMDWIASKSMCRELAARLQRSKDDVPVREYTVDTGSSLFEVSRADSADGWKRAKHAGGFSALSLAFAWELHQELQVPVGILRSTHGATPIETWTAYEGFADHPDLQDIALQLRRSDPRTPESEEAHARFYEDLLAWRVASAELIERGGQALPRPPLPGIADDWKGPTRMYNRKIAPLIPFAIRGAIWCQGTHNAGDGRIYAAKMEALVAGWRKNWGQSDLPFYFTQMQCYGEPNPGAVGFADIREAQCLFFMNAGNVGMVPQYDLNPSRPGGIHYFNKLDPGKRLARWALAHEYGRDIAFTGPLYRSHEIEGGTVRVQFEQRGPGAGLMVGSKGMEGDGDAYVEPARETPGEALRHFRLAGADRVWHAAEARIDGDEVVVTCAAVPEPAGIQYAYCASPIGANLYNRAGLPAPPFAVFAGKQLFNEDDPAIVAAAAAEAERKWGKKTYLLPSTLLRDHAVLQRDRPVPVWGHGVPGTEVTVTFGDQEARTVVGEFEQWSVWLEPMPASARGRPLEIRASDGGNKTIEDVVVGDVWMVTGARSLASELVARRSSEQDALADLPLVREFRIKTKARRFRTPRKLRMEIGGGKYVASWQVADLDEVGDPPSVFAYHFAARVQEPGVPLGVVTLGAESPPLTWISHAGLQTATGFEAERDSLNLAYPNTDVCKAAVDEYIETVQRYNREIAALLDAGHEVPPQMADRAPAFPQPDYNEWVSRTETATHTYNFCISPLTPCAVRGVVWVPGQDNLSEVVSRYTPALEAYAASLAQTYGQDEVQFVYAQPTGALVDGIGKPDVAGALSVELDEWPKSLRGLATQLGALLAAQR